jgi:hypothetical protein
MSKTKTFKRDLVDGMNVMMNRIVQLENVLTSYIDMEGKTEDIKKRLESEYKQRERKRSRRSSKTSKK